jgi:hypothetical protein
MLISSKLLLGSLYELASTLRLAVPVVVALALWRVGPRVRHARFLLGWLGLAMLAMLSTYGLLASDPQVWYVGAPGLVLWLAGMCGCAILGRRFRGALAAALAAASLLLGCVLWVHPTVLYPWQRDVLRSLPEFDARVGPDERVGCFNAGIPAYFGHRRVINLDGLVNHTVHSYWRERRFDHYLDDAGIAYVADEAGSLGRAAQCASAPLRLTPVTSAPLTDWPTGKRILWRVEHDLPAP